MSDAQELFPSVEPVDQVGRQLVNNFQPPTDYLDDRPFTERYVAAMSHYERKMFLLGEAFRTGDTPILTGMFGKEVTLRFTGKTGIPNENDPNENVANQIARQLIINAEIDSLPATEIVIASEESRQVRGEVVLTESMLKNMPSFDLQTLLLGDAVRYDVPVTSMVFGAEVTISLTGKDSGGDPAGDREPRQPIQPDGELSAEISQD